MWLRLVHVLMGRAVMLCLPLLLLLVLTALLLVVEMCLPALLMGKTEML
jgi:hypothetical protein